MLVFTSPTRIHTFKERRGACKPAVQHNAGLQGGHGPLYQLYPVGEAWVKEGEPVEMRLNLGDLQVPRRHLKRGGCVVLATLR